MRLDVDHEAFKRFCRENHVRQLALFGSALREDFGPQSDVDILMELDPHTRLGSMGLKRL